MTALGIRYLTGYAVATNLAIPRRPEWPPHPGRVFMAMAAAHFETQGGEEEREALRWMENADPPAVSASAYQARSFVETYVPVNDRLDKQAGATLRGRQPRAFPTARPDRDSVFLIWDSDIPEQLRVALGQLCSKVTRIGHSSSLVQMWIENGAAEIVPEWQPGKNRSEQQMRVAEPGTIAYLEEVFNGKAIRRYQEFAEKLEHAKGKEKAKIKRELAESFPEGEPVPSRPKLGRWEGYARTSQREAERTATQGPFDPDLIVLTRIDESRVLGLEATLQLTSALRNAAMKAAGENAPEWLSGHQPDGAPSLKPHAAFFPLPFVGAQYADGHVMGLAMAIPRGLSDTALRPVIGSLLFHKNGAEKTIKLWREGAWNWTLEREKRDYPPVTLRAKTWTGPSEVWASVTPVVLHHYPKRNRENDVERILLEAFASAGLPSPLEIRVQPVSFFEGAGHVRAMPEFSEGGEKLCRFQVHAMVRFPVPVEGPVLVGRGRFRGYGLFRTVEAKHA